MAEAIALVVFVLAIPLLMVALLARHVVRRVTAGREIDALLRDGYREVPAAELHARLREAGVALNAEVERALARDDLTFLVHAPPHRGPAPHRGGQRRVGCVVAAPESAAVGAVQRTGEDLIVTLARGGLPGATRERLRDALRPGEVLRLGEGVVVLDAPAMELGTAALVGAIGAGASRAREAARLVVDAAR